METLTLKYTEDSVDYEQEFELLSVSGFDDIDKIELVGIQHRHLDGSVTENITGFRRVYTLDFGTVQDYAQQKFIADFIRNTDREITGELNYAPVVIDFQRFVSEWKDNLKVGKQFVVELIDSRIFGKIVSTLNATLLFDPDNTYDIGAAGATRPRDFHLGRNALIGGTLGLTGNFAINTNKFNVTASNGNTVVAGTLGVTGATTLAAVSATTGTFNGATNLLVNLDRAASNLRDLQFSTAGVARLTIRANATAETGSNAGSNLEIIARTDAGAVSSITTYTRSTGDWSLPANLTVTGIGTFTANASTGVLRALQTNAANQTVVNLINSSAGLNEFVALSFSANNSTPAETIFGRQRLILDGITASSESSSFDWQTRSAGTLATRMTLSSAGNLTVTGNAAVGGATVSSSTGLITPVGTTALSSLRIPHGAAPTSPVNGDMWTTTAGLYVRINGSTVGPLS